MHRLGGSGQIQDALHRREDGVAAAERLLRGEGDRPRDQAAHSDPPREAPPGSPQPGLREAEPSEQQW